MAAQDLVNFIMAQIEKEPEYQRLLEMAAHDSAVFGRITEQTEAELQSWLQKRFKTCDEEKV